MVQQPVGSAAQPVRGIGRAWGLGIGLECMQAPAAHGRAQALPTHGVPVLAQRNLQSAGAIMALVDAKGLDQGRFPSRRLLVRRPLLPRLPRIIPAGRHPEHLAEPPHRVVAALGVDEAVAAHRVSVCEKRAMAFFQISNSCACRLLAARRARTSAASVGSVGKGGWAAFCQA